MRDVLRLSRYTLSKLWLITTVLTAAFSLIALSVPAAMSSWHYNAIAPLQLFWPAVCASLVIPVILALFAFSHLRSRSEADMFMSLPVKSGTKYFSCVLPVYVLSVVCVTVVFALPIFPTLTWQEVVMRSDVMLSAYTVVLCITLATASAAVFCMTLSTGTVSATLSTLTLMFCPCLTVNAAEEMLETLLNARHHVGGGVSLDLTSRLDLINVILNGAWGSSRTEAADVAPYIAVVLYVLAVLVLSAFGYLVYTRCHERSERAFVHPVCRNVFCALWVLPLIFLILESIYRDYGVYIDSGNDGVSFLLFVVPVMFFVTDRIIRGGVKGILRSIISFAVTVLISGAVFIACFIYSGYKPESIDIDHAYVENYVHYAENGEVYYLPDRVRVTGAVLDVIERDYVTDISYEGNCPTFKVGRGAGEIYVRVKDSNELFDKLVLSLAESGYGIYDRSDISSYVHDDNLLDVFYDEISTVSKYDMVKILTRIGYDDNEAAARLSLYGVERGYVTVLLSELPNTFWEITLEE